MFPVLDQNVVRQVWSETKFNAKKSIDILVKKSITWSICSSGSSGNESSRYILKDKISFWGK